jgi:hypothetical protein
MIITIYIQPKEYPVGVISYILSAITRIAIAILLKFKLETFIITQNDKCYIHNDTLYNFVCAIRRE